MMNYWQNLNERERWMVKITGIVVIVYLFYLAIYAPLTAAVTTKTTQLMEKRETLIWMQDVNAQKSGKKAVQSISNSKLLSIIAAQLTSNTLKSFPYQLQQTGTGDIQLNFEQVPYTPALFWLWSLGQEYTLRLKQASIDRTETPGVVKLGLVVSAESTNKS